MHHNLLLSIVELVVSLGCVGTSVQLEVQFTVPGDEISPIHSFLLELVKEVVDRFSHLNSG